MLTKDVQVAQKPMRVSQAAMRAAWLLVGVLNIVLFLAALPAEYAAHTAVASTTYADALRELNLSYAFYARFRTIIDAFTILGFTLIGVVIYWKKPDDFMVFLVSVSLLGFGSLFVPSLYYLRQAQPQWSLPVGMIRAIGLSGSLIVMYYLFPNGRFSPTWTRWASILWAAAVIAWLFFPRTPMNLISLETWLRDLGLSVVFFLAVYATGITAQVYRYRAISTPEQRQQTKWAVVGTTQAVVGFLLYYLPILFLPELQEGSLARLRYSFVAIPVFHLLILSAPLLIGFSVLRYRLWDIGLLINRSISYGVLTLTLIVIYTASVMLLSLAVDGLAAGPRPELVTVVSTLLISVLFVPLRNRLQRWIDQYFYRRHYNTAQELAKFNSLARSEVDINVLSNRLLEVVGEALQPQQASLWLRRDPARPDRY